MKNFCILLATVLLFSSCGDRSKPVHTQAKTKGTVKKADRAEFSPYKLTGDYTVTDTGKYSNGPMEGLYAIIQKNGAPADTIDRGYGMNKLGPQVYLCQSLIRINNPDEKDSKEFLALDFGDYLLIDQGKKAKLESLTKNFDNYFSSPGIISGKIYFWQLEKTDSTGKMKISAAEFDPSTKKTTSHYLIDDFLETDDSGYFSIPFSKKDTITFILGDKQTWKFSKNFKAY